MVHTTRANERKVKSAVLDIVADDLVELPEVVYKLLAKLVVPDPTLYLILSHSAPVDLSLLV